MSFGERLKQLRVAKNLSQEDLGIKLNVSKSSIGMYERNEREPSFQITEKISLFFNKSIDYLISGKSFQETKGNSLIIDITDLNNVDVDSIQQFVDFLKWKTNQEIEDIDK